MSNPEFGAYTIGVTNKLQTIYCMKLIQHAKDNRR